MKIKNLKWIWLLAMAFTLSACMHSGEITEKKIERLATHETVAEFLGTSEDRCLGMTALCPDKCGNSGTMAAFRICAYLNYEKQGKYGDPKTEEFAFLLEDNMNQPKVDRAIQNTVSTLNKGDAVLLSWNHNYVTANGSSGPERPIVKLQRLAAPTPHKVVAYQSESYGTHVKILDPVKITVPSQIITASETPERKEQDNPLPLKTIVYQSVAGEELRVIYIALIDSVILLLPEKTITLPLAISASGARYAADDEVFWNKGTNAWYWKNDTLLFEGHEITENTDLQ